VRSTQVQKEHKRKMGKEKVARTVPHRLGDMLVDREQTYQWLKFLDIKGEQLNFCGPGPSTRHKLFQETSTERRNQK
jgi:hypothetical protein